MSVLYSDSSVVWKVYGEPSATDQPSAKSVARPSTSWCTAKLALMPAPLTSLPCTYRRRTDGPMPFGQTAMTLMFVGKLGADVLQVPEQEAVRQAQRRARAEALEHAAEQLGLRRVGDQQQRRGPTPRTTANISPSVPFASVKPALRGRLHRRRAQRAGRP